MSADIGNIPAHMVRDLLIRGNEVAKRAGQRAASFAKARETIRASLEGLIANVDMSDLETVPRPSVAAIDGALISDSKSIGDLCTAVGVRVGPGEDEGGSDIWMDTVSRSPHNKEVLGGIMSTMEVELAASSTAQVVLMDGSILSGLINISKGLRSSSRTPGALADGISRARREGFRDAVMKVLTSPRFVALPKYTTTNEFSDFLPDEFAAQDARTIATMALRAGEMTYLQRRHDEGRGDGRDDAGRMLIGPALGFPKSQMQDFSDALKGTFSCYYRPHPWTPAFRLDMTAAAYEDPEAQLNALRAVHDTTMTSGLREPFPLYLVDLFAKQISIGAAPVVEMAALNNIDDPDARLLLAMGYRS